MKKTVVLLITLIIAVFSALAEKHGIFMEYHRKSKPGTQTQVPRVPMKLPIDIIYDTEANLVEIVADDTIDANVYVYNCSGAVVYYSSSVNTEFSIAPNECYTIIIDGEGWYAEGVIGDD